MCFVCLSVCLPACSVCLHGRGNDTPTHSHSNSHSRTHWLALCIIIQSDSRKRLVTSGRLLTRGFMASHRGCCTSDQMLFSKVGRHRLCTKETQKMAIMQGEENGVRKMPLLLLSQTQAHLHAPCAGFELADFAWKFVPHARTDPNLPRCAVRIHVFPTLHVSQQSSSIFASLFQPFLHSFTPSLLHTLLHSFTPALLHSLTHSVLPSPSLSPPPSLSLPARL